MPTLSSHVAQNRTAPLWSQIESLLAQLASEAVRDVAPDSFFRELIDRSAELLGCRAAIAWLRQPNSTYSVIASHARGEPIPYNNGAWIAFHRRHFARFKDASYDPVVEPNSSHDARDLLANPESCLLLLAPIRAGDEIVGALEFVLPAASRPEARLGYRRFVESLSAVAADYLRGARLRLLQRDAGWSQRRERFVQKLHANLDRQLVAFELANEGRVLIGWDRLSVLVRRGERYRVLAVSGADSVDSRAHGMQLLADLATVVAHGREPLRFEGDTTDLPPEIDGSLQPYVDHAHVQQLLILPLPHPRNCPSPLNPGYSKNSEDPVGVLVAENYSRKVFSELPTSPEWLADVGATALTNAAEFEAIPYAALWRRWRSRMPRERKQWIAATTICLCAAIAALFLIPATLHVAASGELQPKLRRHVYAQTDGIVEQVVVEHGAHVQKGDLLVVMRNPQLDVEIEALTTKLSAARVQLEGVSTTLMERRFSNDVQQVDERTMSAQKQSLTHEVEALQNQLDILQRQHDGLHLHSPLSGQVITWDLKQRLLDRPVRHGDALLTVADPADTWVVELQVPNSSVGHLITADVSKSAAAIRFVMMADPSTLHTGRVSQMALAAEYDDHQGATVRVTADVDSDLDNLRMPGAEVRAKIDCGTHSLGFVWFHGVIDAIRGTVLL